MRRPLSCPNIQKDQESFADFTFKEELTMPISGIRIAFFDLAMPSNF
jgi:hypothetical protein